MNYFSYLALWLLILYVLNSPASTAHIEQYEYGKKQRSSWPVRKLHYATKVDIILSLGERLAPLGLKQDQMQRADQQRIRDYKKRSVSFDDPDWSGQEYLKSGSNIGHNVDAVWEKGFTGKDITVAVIDDGLKYTHQEFKGRYMPDLSYDYIDNDKSPDPSPLGHGTRCAGVIAADADNRICGVGVAYEANIAAIRLIDNKPSSDVDEAKAFYPSPGHSIDIFSNSWGPVDNAREVRGPKTLSQRALKEGVTQGRNGLGSIYVFAAGNGAFFSDSCAFNGYVNSIYTIPVGGVIENRKISGVTETCSAIMTAAYSSKLKTASSSDNVACDKTFGQTSGATALVSGIIALALQARKSLTWRDVQHLVVRSSNPAAVDDKNANWIVNKAGFKVSNRVGFGVLDASTLVRKALEWNVSVPRQIKCEINLGSPQYLSDEVDIATFRLDVNRQVCSDGVIRHLEHVLLRIDLRYFIRGVIAAYITSPGGTNSQVLYPRTLDTIFTRAKNYTNWTTTSVQFWGERSNGSWTISFKKGIPNSQRGNGTLRSLSLILYGTETNPESERGSNENGDKNNGTVSTGVLVGIVVAVIVFIILVIVVVLLFVLPKFRHHRTMQHDNNETGIIPQEGHSLKESHNATQPSQNAFV